MVENEMFEIEFVDGEIICNGMINTTNIELLACCRGLRKDYFRKIRNVIQYTGGRNVSH